MAQSANHLSGVEVEARRRDVVGEVQQAHQSFSVPAVLQHRHALPVHRVVRVNNVQPVAAVVKVCLGQARRTKEVLVAQRDSGKCHVVCPDHVDLRDGGEREKVEQAVPGPDKQKHQAHADGQKPEAALRFGFVRRKNVPQPMDLGSEHELHARFSFEICLLRFRPIISGNLSCRERHHSLTGS